MPKKISLYEDKLYWTNDATGYPIFKCKVFSTIGAQCESVPVKIFAPIEIFMISQQAKQINGKLYINYDLNNILILLIVNFYNIVLDITTYSIIFLKDKNI